MLAAEITREKIYARLHDELPYHTTVETTAWQEKKNGVRIEQIIFVERDSQKSIVLGKRRKQMIRQLSMEARKELAEILEQPVHLILFVKVRQNWEEDPERYREMGLTFLPRASLGPERQTARRSRLAVPWPASARWPSTASA